MHFIYFSFKRRCLNESVNSFGIRNKNMIINLHFVVYLVLAEVSYTYVEADLESA